MTTLDDENFSSKGGQNDDDVNKKEDVGKPVYAMPGIIQYLQSEWAKFEIERAQWNVERAELTARIAFLQGERKGQENLRQDLVRRIKMLEFALKQERIKFHKLKYGTEPNNDSKPTSLSGKNDARVRTLLGLQPLDQGSADRMLNDEMSRKTRPDPKGQMSLAQQAMLESEESVLDVMSFLQPSGADDDDSGADRDAGDEKLMDPDDGNDESEEALAEFDFLLSETSDSDLNTDSGMTGDDKEKWDVDKSALKRLTDQYKKERKHVGGPAKRPNATPWSSQPSDGSRAMQGNMSEQSNEGGDQQVPTRDVDESAAPPYGHGAPIRTAGGEAAEESLALGSLASISVANEAEHYEATVPESTATQSGGSTRKVWQMKYSLRSHFDAVRSLAFHPVEAVLITASEDHTLKLWNLNKTIQQSRKATSLEVEPLYTFRGHSGPVMCTAVSPTGEQCFSGGFDGTVRCWNIPSANLDPYDSYDASVMQATLEGHTDAVWGLALHSARMQLLTCSADGSVRLWNPTALKQPLLNTYKPDIDCGVPTCIDFIRSDMNQMVAAYADNHTFVFDLETGKTITQLCSDADFSADGQTNRVVSHPTIPLTVTAHDDKYIRFYDHSTGKLVHQMVAHLDAVTSLAVDPNGLFLLSSSHDCSIRLWSIDSKTCIQELTAHRKKLDESIHDVAFHPSKPYLATAGADALSKVYT